MELSISSISYTNMPTSEDVTLSQYLLVSVPRGAAKKLSGLVGKISI